MAKKLEQLQHYQIHYQQIYPRANKKGKAVIRKHLKKLTKKIKSLQRQLYRSF